MMRPPIDHRVHRRLGELHEVLACLALAAE
jgi:hypothetical protein